MRNLILICLLLSSAHLIFSQTTEILQRSDKQYTKKGKDFACLNAATDTAALAFVARIKATGKKNKGGIQSLYFTIQTKAKTMGANAFKLHEFVRNDSTDETLLVLDAYYGTHEVLRANAGQHDKNIIIIFGGEKSRETEKFSFKVNSDKKVIKSGTFFRYSLKEDEEVKISAGGLTGSSMWFKWKENKLVIFLILFGFGVGGGNASTGSAGVSSKTRQLNFVDANLGYLLIQLLRPAE